MVRTQIQLTEVQHRRLRRAARVEGISVAELVRRCVDRALDEVRPVRSDLYARAAQLIVRFDDREAARDLSSDHDHYFVDSAQG